jgi:hypothetical protein
MALMGYFGNWKNAEFVSIQEFEGCEGAIVMDVFMDFPRRMFGIVLARDDWPEVAEGTIPPSLNGPRSRIVQLKPIRGKWESTEVGCLERA